MKIRRSKLTNDRPRKRSNESGPVSGGSSRRVYSYYSSGSSEDAAPVERKSSTRPSFSRLRYLPGLIAVVVIVFSVLYSFTLGTYPEVEVLNKQSSPYRNMNDYAAATDEILNKRLLNRTKFTIHTGDVERSLLGSYPELQDAVLRLPVLGRKPTLVIDIRQPALLLSTSSDLYVIDSNGIVVAKADKLSAKDKEGLLVIRDLSGIDTAVGKQVLVRDTVKFILDSRYYIHQQGMSIRDLVLPVSINQLDIYIDGIEPYIKTDTSGDARLQIGSFVATYKHLSEQGTGAKEYIDVRVEEKIFYK